MNFFVSEIVTPPAHLPVTVDDAQAALAAAVTDEIERSVLWRALVRQTRKILFDGALPQRIELEPVSSIVSLTRWEPARFPMRKSRGRGGAGSDDSDEIIPASAYNFVSRDPQGTVITPLDGTNWPEPKRSIGSFALTYDCGWAVTPESAPGAGDAVNTIPPSVRFMLERALAFRAGAGGLAELEVGSLKLDFADSYKTDALPKEIAGIGRAWAYRPGIFAARP